MQPASKRKADEEAGAKIKADEEAKKTDEEAQAKRQQHRRLAESGLKRAMSMAEVELLVPAINWAVQQGADSELIARARTQKTSLEEAKCAWAEPCSPPMRGREISLRRIGA